MHKHHQELFHLPAKAHYFLTHSIGLMPRNNEHHINQHYLDHWRNSQDDIWSKWLNGIAHFNQALGQLLNAKPEQFCPQSNISSGLSKVIMALPEKAKRSGRNVIVATENDFPSAGFVLKQAEKLGFTLRLIPTDKDLQSLDIWEAALGDDVYATFITQVHYNTNKLTPVQQITEICRTKNIVSIVDIAQAVGIVPIDLSTLNADIVLGSCVKWLCGGPGAGFIWLTQEKIEQLEPLDVGWFSHKNPFEFDINHFEYANTAARFWGGTPSVAAYITATNSIQIIKEIGVDIIRTHNQTLTKKIMTGVAEECIASPIDLDLKGGTLVLKFPKKAKIEQCMLDAGLLFDSRQYGIRLSPHIYTSEHDIDVLINCLET